GVTPPGAGRIGETGGERLVSGLARPSQQPVPADAERFGCDAEVDEERLSYDVRSRQESPVTTVVGLVPVVAHDEVMPRGHDDRTPVVRGRMVVHSVAPGVVAQLPRPDLAQLDDIHVSRIVVDRVP